METWAALLAAFGGQIAILAALAYFGRRFFDHFLDKAKTEHIETIKQYNASSLEGLKSSLTFISGTKKYRFEKVYDKQLVVLEKAYSGIVASLEKLEEFTSPFGAIDDERIERGLKAYDQFLEVYDHCKINKIWLKKETADSLMTVLFEIRSHILKFRMLIVEKKGLFSSADNKEYRVQSTKEWVNTIDDINAKIKGPLIMLEDDFRMILGVIETD
jgi:hypothetical protein